MKDNIIKSYVKDMLINALRALKDEEYQRRVWFDNESHIVDTFIDSTIHFLGRCRDIFKNPKCEEELGQKNYVKLKQLYDLVEGYVDLTEETIDFTVSDIEEKRLLDDPNWHKIQTLSDEVYYKLSEYVNRG